MTTASTAAAPCAGRPDRAIRTLADARRPESARLAYDAVLVLAGSVLIALAARVAFPLPFSPVPVTGQTFGVLLVAAALGSRRGTLAVLAYLAEGAAGLPVFALGGGAAYLLGPTGGYLLGFLPAAALTGALAERGWDRRHGTTALVMALGTATILACGAVWLAFFVGAEQALMAGVVPFLPGGIVKIALAMVALPWVWRIVGRAARR